MSQQILVCQNRTCRKQGAKAVLRKFQAQLDTIVRGCGCLGYCGNGPTVVVLPEGKFYERVQPEDVEYFRFKSLKE
ncbi:MAG: (2Fe-2S) ferredoxin domain-containing protein [Kamptonema sp. SIO4C4]|nr:(2Fe-2S) ferredoxin domain-containing protein [Kamptonema sp. SIO4C4]